jgi:hypothetical protein
MNRPRSVTIVAWIIIVLGIAGVLLSMRATSQGILTSMQLASLYIGLAVAIVSGIFMLHGKNWSRWFYVAWCIFGLAYATRTTPNPLLLIPGALKTAIIAFILFRGPANSFFSRASSQIPAGP